jgi:hypothetical protein
VDRILYEGSKVTIADYTPLCDVKGCNEPQCGEECELNYFFSTISSSWITLRVHLCKPHLKLLQR